MAARPLPVTPIITINADGTWSPKGGVTIGPKETVQFNLPTWNPGHNKCNIHFTVTWEKQQAPAVKDPGGTIVIGS